MGSTDPRYEKKFLVGYGGRGQDVAYSINAGCEGVPLRMAKREGWVDLLSAKQAKDAAKTVLKSDKAKIAIYKLVPVFIGTKEELKQLTVEELRSISFVQDKKKKYGNVSRISSY